MTSRAAELLEPLNVLPPAAAPTRTLHEEMLASQQQKLAKQKEQQQVRPGDGG